MRVGQSRKRDSNEAAIVDALRAVGATVERLSGKDIPDLLVGFGGVNHLLEVKVPGNDQTPGQVEWGLTWRGGPVWVVRSADDVLAILGCKARRTG